MWKPHQSSDLGRKNTKAGVLLAHNAQRRDRAGKKMQGLSGACQDISSPISTANDSHKPLAFPTMGARHIGTSTHWNGPVQIYHCVRELFCQMSRSRAFGNDHITEGSAL